VTRRLGRAAARVGLAILWVGLVVLIGFAAAGLVAALDHPAGTAARADLTAAGDAQVTPLLDFASSNIGTISDEVDQLAEQARAALASLNGGDDSTTQAALAKGNELLKEIGDRTTVVRASLESVPYVGTPTASLSISDPVAARHAALLDALASTDGLRDAWVRLTTGSVSATRMGALLAAHDQLVGQAALLGTQARYTDAIKLIDQAGQQLAAARALRDQLASTVDVSVLDEWIALNQQYDTALRRLYKAISTVRGRVTTEVRDAIDAERAAKARLPADTRGLVVIMADIGRGGLNQAVIAIEEARGELDAAIATAGGPTGSAEPSPTGSPEASPAASASLGADTRIH